MVGFASCFVLLCGMLQVLKDQIFRSSVLLVALALGQGSSGIFSTLDPRSPACPGCLWKEPQQALFLCQIDLRDQKKVTGIITQGARDFGHIQYVAAYKVAYSDNGTSWTLYRDGQTNSTKVRAGQSEVGSDCPGGWGCCHEEGWDGMMGWGGPSSADAYLSPSDLPW